MQAEVSTETAERVDPHTTIDFWLKFLKTARDNKFAKRHRSDATEAWKQYEKDYDDLLARANTNTRDKLCVYPLYWANCQTLEPAFYARTPVCISKREFEINDDIANTMCLISERLGKYQTRVSNFDDVMGSCVGDFLHAAKATAQIVYEAQMVKQPKRIALMPSENPDVFLDEKSQPYLDDVQQDEQGYFGMTEVDVADEESQKIYIAPAGYDEILHTPNARSFQDIKAMAYPFRYTKDEAYASGKFDETVLTAYPWKTKDQKAIKDRDQGQEDALESAEPYMDGYEIYCKNTKHVYWVSESYRENFLRPAKPDPYQFKDFFPSPPFIMQNKPRKHLYPRPAYIHLRPTLDQLNLMYERVFELIDAVRRRAIVDGDEDIVRLLNAGELEFISAKSLKSIVEKGGLDKMIWYLPVQELVQAISELNALEDRFQNNASQWQGVPDILRGASDPIEAMGTQQIKSTAAQDRFKVNKKDVQRLARDLIEMMVDLALQVFSDAKIARICGFDYMSKEDQGRFKPALDALRVDTERVIRIDIETDSMTFVDEGLKAAQMGATISSFMQGMQEIGRIRREDPKLALIAAKALLLTLEQSSDGKEFQDDVKALSKEIEDELKNPPDLGPPPPDYEMLKIESATRMKQMELQQKAEGDKFNAQVQQVSEQAQMQLEMQKLQTQAQKDANDAQIRVNELSFKQEELNVTAQLKSRELDIAQGVAANNAALEQFQIQLKESAEKFQQQIQTLTLQLEAQAAQQSMAEKMAEEKRLSLQQIIDLHVQHTAATQQQAAQPRESAPNLPPIHINVDAKTPVRKKARISTGPDGSSTIEEIDDDDDLS